MTAEVSLSVDKIYHPQVCPLNWREITIVMAANKQFYTLRKTLYHCQYLIKLKRKKNGMKVKKYILFLGKKTLLSIPLISPVSRRKLNRKIAVELKEQLNIE
mgnify:CR=1 FL=1